MQELLDTQVQDFDFDDLLLTVIGKGDKPPPWLHHSRRRSSGSADEVAMIAPASSGRPQVVL